MINEKSHLKISFASLAQAPLTNNAWIDWSIGDLKNASVTFALEVDEHGQECWRCMRSTFYALPDNLLAGFKQGAVYESEVGLRTVGGIKLSAEKYLDLYDALPCVDIAETDFSLRYEIQVPIERQARVYTRGDFKWEHEDGEVTIDKDVVTVRKTLDNAMAAMYLMSACESASIELVSRAHGASMPSGAGATGSLFALES